MPTIAPWMRSQAEALEASAHALVYEAFQNLSHGRFARLIGATTAYMVQAFALFFTQATRL
ncbi:MAG: hypothetical protein ACLQBA_05990 [Candidatus Binataceae bacterium]